MSLRKGDDITLVGEQYVWQRTYTYQEVSLLADLSGFDIVATYGDLDLEVPMDDPECRSLVAILQKPEGGSDSEFLESLL